MIKLKAFHKRYICWKEWCKYAYGFNFFQKIGILFGFGYTAWFNQFRNSLERKSTYDYR